MTLVAAGKNARVTDGRLPAIVGAAQAIQRPEDWSDPVDALGPIELMTRAVRDAADDAGAPGLLEQVDWIGVVGGFWSYQDPGRLVAESIGAPGARTALAAISGSAPQDLVGIAAERVARGEIEVALVVGGEAGAARKKLRSLGIERAWNTDAAVGTPEAVGAFEPEMIEEMRVLGVAATAYALLDDSLRLHTATSMEDHRTEISQLWERFSRVAARNPYAWDRTEKTAAQIREATPDNRMIAFPYTKAHVANNTVDLSSAVIITSEATARAAGVSDERFVYPHVSTSSHETWQVVHRNLMHETPALATAGRMAMEYAGLTPDTVQYVDLYACFPAIVRMSAASLGFDLTRDLTVTGGLGFAGAPVSNSSGQAIAAMVPMLRSGGWGFIHANGGNATKHGFGVYSAERPAKPFARIDAQSAVDLVPRPGVSSDWDGTGDVEAATVAFDRDGPTHVVAALLDDGARGLVRSDDADLIETAMTKGLGGVRGPLPRATQLT
jgi:acetyl-CoA C-acetyltransferase